MSHNQLTGTFPFANTEYRLLQDGGNKFLMRQQKSDFSYNRMSGTIDIILGLLPNLRYADYSGNGFNGQVSLVVVTYVLSCFFLTGVLVPG